MCILYRLFAGINKGGTLLFFMIALGFFNNTILWSDDKAHNTKQLVFFALMAKGRFTNK